MLDRRLFDLAAGYPLLSGFSSDFIDSAVQHGMQGLLWRRCVSGEFDLSGGVARRLAMEYMRVRRHHIAIRETLSAITSLFDRHGIGFVVLKGVANEARWYGEIGDRPSSDLDLWVSPRDTRRFAEAIRLLDPGHFLASAAQGLVDKGYIQSVDVCMPSGIVVDLHADPFNFGLRTRSSISMWERSETLSLNDDLIVKVLDPSSALVHTLVHLNQDGFGSMVGFADTRRILQDDRLDVDLVRSMLREEGLLTHGLLTLRAVEHALGTHSGFLDSATNPPWWWRFSWPSSSFLRRNSKGRKRLSAYAVRFTAIGRKAEAIAWTARRLVRPIVTLALTGRLYRP